MKILLVDDEAELAEPLSRVLMREGYQVDLAFDGQAGKQLATTHSYDLLILDWMLPHCSGLEICQQVRSRGDATPVLFLTAKDTLDDRVEGLDAGADDYINKPLALSALLARVRALLRRPPQIETSARSPKLYYDDLELDEANQLASRQGETIELSEKETQLLSYFLRYPDQVLTRSQIHQAVWADMEEPASNVLAAQMRLLRRKIEPKGTLPLIHTVYGKGYRLGR